MTRVLGIGGVFFKSKDPPSVRLGSGSAGCIIWS